MENVGAVTDEKRARKLAYRRAWKRALLANETPVERETRLQRIRDARRKKMLAESADERDLRLACARQRAQARRSAETPEQLAARRTKAREAYIKFVRTERDEDRAARLDRARDRSRKEGASQEGRAGKRERNRKWRQTPEGRRTQFTRSLEVNYGLSRDEYDRILVAASGRCDVCGDTRDGAGRGLCLDHDHITGEIRGMLCWGCNTALGNLRDSPLLIAKLAAYASGIGRSA